MLDCLIAHQVCAGLDLEGKTCSLFFHFCCKFFDPMLVQCKHIVAEPDVLDTGALLKLTHLCRDSNRGTQLEFIAGDRLCTPVAAIRAATAGYHVGGEVAVSLYPCGTIWLKVDQIARGQGKVCPGCVL